MSGGEMIEKLDVIEGLCVQLAEAMQAATSQGRMPAVEEARRMDVLSENLMESIGALPENPLDGMDQMEQRQRAAALLKRATELLAPLLSTTPARTAARMPAAASRLAAYGNL